MTPRADNPRLAILLMVGFCVLAPLSEVFVKLIGATLPLAQVVFARFAAQLLLLRKDTWANRESWFTKRLVALIMLRAVLHVLAITMFFLSLRYLPLADALAIVYVMPFFIMTVGWLTGDTLRPSQIGLACLGFLGTLMVVQPSFAEVGWPAILPILTAIVFTGFMFITRVITPHITPVDLQAVNGVVAVAILGPALVWGTMNVVPEVMIMQTTQIQLIYLLGVGILGTLAHLFMTWGLSLATPSTVAPIQYIEIVFGAVFGFFVFKDLPNGLAAIGIALVMIAGLMVLATTPKSGPKSPAAAPPLAE